ncbi:uracil-DNA glycosylase family protein [Sphingomonas sp. BK580]|uniref:uracil-DNA glycosylase family protein n=1 Tax=Sphingomonas sp. BK580 TaxID=2586972 RepID=UPI00161B3C43|nr:uracil-DNA glycosylase family protein [Sphingomonas sp. BK580]MBB3691719.1 uracil-DNA glycosylase [Sphingomonas sp. BK580]
MSAHPDAHAPLERWRSQLATGGRDVPGFDPNDGGAAARLLLLLETPGAHGPAIVSRDHATGTSRNLKRFLADAGIERRDTLLWNAVPWNVHAPGERNRPLRRAEIAEGLSLLPPLLHLLPRLELVVLAGRVAREAAALVDRERPLVGVLTMPHPSPTFVCTSPAVPRAIAATLAEAAARLSRAGGPAPR